MSVEWFLAGIAAGTIVTTFTLALLTAAKRADELEVDCPQCHGTGAFVETVEATGRPRPVFCICSLGRTYMEHAATAVDFAAVVKRAHVEWPHGGAQ